MVYTGITYDVGRDWLSSSDCALLMGHVTHHFYEKSWKNEKVIFFIFQGRPSSIQQIKDNVGTNLNNITTKILKNN